VPINPLPTPVPDISPSNLIMEETLNYIFITLKCDLEKQRQQKTPQNVFKATIKLTFQIKLLNSSMSELNTEENVVLLKRGFEYFAPPLTHKQKYFL